MSKMTEKQLAKWEKSRNIGREIVDGIRKGVIRTLIVFVRDMHLLKSLWRFSLESNNASCRIR